ncbi:malonyl-CoA:anthocyanidin 5-O-glucoside-6''-O-malonyltransferase-like [Euphorbia lathyris]|uniref:malonyl-CoA:anthocyanidin 5-O-glucoside-6''-O-malonyltransferase-like n=1 Tax=Euphorbia lathyris TaxID=212925 RepID=UPI0033136683
MASSDSHAAVRVTELCKITPPDSPTDSSLPLTFFDIFWLKFHPVERIFFYQLTSDSDSDSDSDSFSSDILPRLKQSLSLTLLHFIPFAGNLIWPSHSDKPFLLYSPGDGVSLTVAESDADFHTLAGDSIREIPDSHNYVPELNVTETEAATMSFQITLFPKKGYCIGISSHHGIFDGKSIIMFIKAWAHICKNGSSSLPPELTPVIDRAVIQDHQGLESLYLNSWMSLASLPDMDSNPRSLKLFNMPRSTSDTNYVRGTFKLSGEDIKKIRQKTFSQLDKEATNQANSKYFSTFVLSYAYVSITITKAKALEPNKHMILGFTADVRARQDPPISTNYFGNCVSINFTQHKVGIFIKEDGLAFVAEELTKLVKGLEKKGGLDGAKEKFEESMKMDPATTEGIGVAGSPRFEVYGIDFGFGKPIKVEITSIDRNTSISMAETRDGNGGVEIGVVLKKDEMEIFYSLFLYGLKDL